MKGHRVMSTSENDAGSLAGQTPRGLYSHVISNEVGRNRAPRARNTHAAISYYRLINRCAGGGQPMAAALFSLNGGRHYRVVSDL